MRKGLVLLAFLAFLSVPCRAWVPEPSPVPSAPEPQAYIALSFDDGPSGPITEALLDGLRDRNAHATFFLCGYRMAEYPSPLPRFPRV